MELGKGFDDSLDFGEIRFSILQHSGHFSEATRLTSLVKLWESMVA